MHKLIGLETQTAANQAIFRIQSGVCQLFRDYLLSQHFTEIHSPKIISAASEGGAEVFAVKYFDGMILFDILPSVC
jgi:aspartyl/asparaginyl-tRNA synthetase